MSVPKYGFTHKLKIGVKRGIVRAIKTPMVRRAILDHLESRRVESLDSITNVPGPITGSEKPARIRERSDIVFVTGRFRSGSTTLWNAFRQLEEVTAYYEPFNERCFFDKGSRGDGVDPTHLGVDDYAREYDATSGLTELYDEDWTRRSLYMDANAWNPDMLRFIERLVECAPGRPVLQFNRVDFRLPWLRARFPAAKIVHLWRNPREQWCSVIGDIDSFPYDTPPQDFPDRFYQSSWESDLRQVMPFLRSEDVSHPYRRFYLMWKTSWLFGQRYGSISISYDELVTEPAQVLGRLATELGMHESAASRMTAALRKPHAHRWPGYACESWFAEHEQACEALLDEFFGAGHIEALKEKQPESRQ